MTSRLDRVLNNIYTELENPSSFSSINKLYNEARKELPDLKLNDVRQWLSGRDSYTLHRQARKRFRRNRIYVKSIDEQWEIDLVDLTAISQHNDNYKFILTCIDVLSKKAWARGLHSKHATVITEAFKTILDEGRKPWQVRSDKGKEFVNETFKKLLRNEGIHFFTSQNEDIKCSIVERFNRTLKSKMWRYFTENNTYKWIDVLSKLIRGYNESEHRSIKMKPNDVSEDNQRLAYNNLYPEIKLNEGKNFKIRKTSFNIGDTVRISKFRQHFDKGYVPQWTEEIFKIIAVSHQKTQPVYRLVDLTDEPIKGTFYRNELQKVMLDKDRTYKIETIIKKRRLSDGRIQYFVKWRGYPEKFNQWIDGDYMSAL
jgi:hypothetical protein